MQEINIYISTCPNDIFIFGNLIKRKVVDQYFTFSFHYYDIEELNQLAFNNFSKTIIKVSFPTYFQLKNDYELLDCGSALGYKCGPIFVSNNHVIEQDWNIVVPGFHTTAYLLTRFYLSFQNKRARFHHLIFHQIPEKIQQNHFDAGVLIHEGRFLYESWGLKKIVDLGDFWEEKTGLPIPLAGILLSKDLTPYKSRLEMIIRKSLKHAYSNYSYLLPLIKQLSQEKDESIIWKHIETFVNHFSFELGEKGKEAIKTLEGVYRSVFN